MNIGEAASASGVSTKMIRYYEDIGLIKPVTRTMAGYRVYAEKDIHALRFIRRARDLGFTVEQMTELMALWNDRARASGDVKRIALEHVKVLEQKRQEIEDMATALKHLALKLSWRREARLPDNRGLGQRARQPHPRHTSRQGFREIALICDGSRRKR